LLGDDGRKSGVAEADEAGISEDFYEQPVVEGEITHRGFSEGH